MEQQTETLQISSQVLQQLKDKITEQATTIANLTSQLSELQQLLMQLKDSEQLLNNNKQLQTTYSQLSEKYNELHNKNEQLQRELNDARNRAATAKMSVKAEIEKELQQKYKTLTAKTVAPTTFAFTMLIMWASIRAYFSGIAVYTWQHVIKPLLSLPFAPLIIFGADTLGIVLEVALLLCLAALFFVLYNKTSFFSDAKKILCNKKCAYYTASVIAVYICFAPAFINFLNRQNWANFLVLRVGLIVLIAFFVIPFGIQYIKLADKN